MADPSLFPSHFGPKPMNITCPYCKRPIMTKVDYTCTMKTHIVALVLCICTGCCCWIPYVCASCKKPTHSCPTCKNYLGSYEN